jgi:hypothetical protein
MKDQKQVMPGVPLFKTDLFIPDYNEGEIGNWRIQKLQLGFDHGYITGVSAVEKMTILARRCRENCEKWEAWMSISPHEIESQQLCCRYAYGHTVIMGLGLGWIAINTAMNERVEKVTVVELDPEVIDLFNQSGAPDHLPVKVLNKIEIVLSDAMKWRSEKRKTNFLYVDIWRTLAEPSVMNDLRSMQNNLCADLIYYWGQELTIYTELQKAGYGDKPVTAESVRFCAEQLIKLPLLIPTDINYAAMITRVVEQRKQRRLPLSRKNN